MAISGVTDYINTYAGYTNSANSKKQVSERACTEQETTARKTAKDELSCLTEKYECMKSKDYSVNINSSLLAKATSDEKLYIGGVPGQKGNHRFQSESRFKEQEKCA